MYTCEAEIRKTYEGLKKCVLSDYPYSLKWIDEKIYQTYYRCHTKILDEHSKILNTYYSDENGNGLLKLEYLDHYAILCYRFARMCYETGEYEIADAVYYSSRVRCSIDLYYKTDLGPYFIPTHALGTAMDSHAKYGKLFRIYNGCHIGPYSLDKPPVEWEHPLFGDYVTMLGGSKVFGKTIVGNNVIIASNTVLINEEVPNNCIVTGQSPNLYYLPLKKKNSLLLREE